MGLLFKSCFGYDQQATHKGFSSLNPRLSQVHYYITTGLFLNEQLIKPYLKNE
jgi:hypothetical protein